MDKELERRCRAIVKWMPEWEVRYDKVEEAWGVIYEPESDQPFLIGFWLSELLEDRNIWYEVEERIYKENLSMEYIYKLQDEKTFETPASHPHSVIMKHKICDIETCVIAAVKLEPIQEIMEEMECEKKK